jgi:hypothetical protein
MATNLNPTKLGSLEFTQIKNSLTNYLRSQSVFSGYNFEGSALQTIIDLMAYNTFYYAYYANLINAEAFLDSAQREESLISLCKPLGFTVPSSTSAKARVKVAGISNASSIPAGTKFFTANADGIQYSFYNLNEVAIDADGNTDEFDIYEATNFIEGFDAFPTFDFDSQKIVIVSDNFDLNTLKVTITEDGSNYIWTKINNVGYVSQTDERIYFVERTSNGFIIAFGSNNSLGKSITEENVSKIIIRYLTTSGADANGLLSFTMPGFQGNYSVLTISQSSGGKSKPDLNTIRFLAPKWFASQERAVTVNDYKALLIEAGFFENENEFNVFGGQDLTPPKYGRVFITSNVSPNATSISEFLNYLKDKSVITVYPEYVVSNSLNVYADFFFRLNVGSGLNRSVVLSGVKSKFAQNYAKYNQYNVSFSATDFIEYIQGEYNNQLDISTDNFTLYMRQQITSGKDYAFNLDTELSLPLYTYVDITEPFDCSVSGFPSGTKGVLKMFATTVLGKNSKINLQLWSRNETTGSETQVTGDFGYFIANKGVIYIKNGIIENTAIVDVKFDKKTFKIGLNNLTTFTGNNINLL